MVAHAVNKGKITREEYRKITDEEYTGEEKVR